MCKTHVVDSGGCLDQHLGFGCVRIGSTSGQGSWRSDVELVRAAADAGITVFDTADAYGNGASERILGRALNARRDEVTIATKVGYRFSDRPLMIQSVIAHIRPLLDSVQARGTQKGPPRSRATTAYSQQDFTPSYLRGAVESSLRRLDTEYIDVVQLHGPPAVMPDLIGQLDDLVCAGKVLRWGVGAESVDSACEWIRSGSTEVVQLPFGILDPEALDHAVPEALSRGVELWARAVFGGGILADAVSGKITGPPDPQRDPSPDTHHKWHLLKSILDLAAEMGATPFELALDYARSIGGFSTIIVGIRSLDHLEDNLRMFQRPRPSPELLGRIAHAISNTEVPDEHD